MRALRRAAPRRGRRARRRRCRPTAARADASSEPRPSARRAHAFAKRAARVELARARPRTRSQRGIAGRELRGSGTSACPSAGARPSRAISSSTSRNGASPVHARGRRGRPRRRVSRPCAGESSASSAGDEAQLDREVDRVALEDLRAAPRTASARARAGSRTPSRRSARAAGWRRSRYDAVDALARGRPPRREAVDARDRAREARAPSAAQRSKRVVVEQHVLQPRAGAARRRERRVGRGRSCASARAGECGNVQNSKWSFASTRSSRESSTSSSGTRRVDAAQRGTRARSAASPRSTTPSEPSATRAARSRSPSPAVSVARLTAARRRARAPSTCGREVRRGARRSRACRWRARRRATGRRCRRGSGSARPRSASAAAERGRVIPASTRPGRSRGRRRGPGRAGPGAPACRRWARTARTSARSPPPAPSGPPRQPAGPRPPPRAPTSGARSRRGRTTASRAQLLHMPRTLHGCDRLTGHVLGARARGAAPPRGARARRMGGDGARRSASTPAGRLTVRERIERLLDPGTLPRDRRAGRRRRATATTASSTAFMPANMVVGQGAVDGRGARRAGRRLHRPRRRRRRRDLAEDGLRRADGARPAPAARAARRRHRRRRLGQVARSRWASPTCPSSPGWRSPSTNLARSCRSSPPRSGRWPGSAPRASSPRHFSVIVRGTAPAVRGRPAAWWRPRWASRPTRRRSAASRAQTRAGAVDNEAADEDDALAQLRRFLSYLPANVWELPPIGAATDPPDRREEELLLDRPARPAQALRDAARSSRSVLDRGSLFELGAAPRPLG